MRVALSRYKRFSLPRDYQCKIQERRIQEKTRYRYCLFPIMCRHLNSQHVHCVSYVEEEPVAVNRMGM